MNSRLFLSPNLRLLHLPLFLIARHIQRLIDNLPHLSLLLGHHFKSLDPRLPKFNLLLVFGLHDSVLLLGCHVEVVVVHLVGLVAVG